MNFDDFADTCKITAANTEENGIFRAIELDVEHNHSTMLDCIRALMEAQRIGNAERVTFWAGMLVDEFDRIREFPEFEADPIRELMAGLVRPVVNAGLVGQAWLDA